MTWEDIVDEADRIKARIRSCQTVEEIEAAADEERAAVKALAETKDGRPFAIQLANMKAYYIDLIQRGIKR